MRRGAPSRTPRSHLTSFVTHLTYPPAVWVAPVRPGATVGWKRCWSCLGPLHALSHVALGGWSRRARGEGISRATDALLGSCAAGPVTAICAGWTRGSRTTGVSTGAGCAFAVSAARSAARRTCPRRSGDLITRLLARRFDQLFYAHTMFAVVRTVLVPGGVPCPGCPGAATAIVLVPFRIAVALTPLPHHASPPAWVTNCSQRGGNRATHWTAFRAAAIAALHHGARRARDWPRAASAGRAHGIFLRWQAVQNAVSGLDAWARWRS